MQDSLKLPQITALSVVDGREAGKVESLRSILSEFGLIRNRIHVEIEWLIALSENSEIGELKPFTETEKLELRALASNFEPSQALEVKEIETTTNHDVKAVEYYLKKHLKDVLTSDTSLEFIHFGCTSEDITNLSYALMLSEARDVVVRQLNAVKQQLNAMATQYASVVMLSRTHGQTASPTTVGKEFANFLYRLNDQGKKFQSIEVKGKFNGPVGNFNAHFVAYPDLDWPLFAKNFVESLGLTYHPMTAQSDPHDDIAEYCHCLQRTNSILIDLARDMWGYISLGYFQQKLVENEVGSSTMPHKINPIDFENAEGNLGVANALLGHLATKLPISRWQRDLSDSTTRRNLGSAIGHCMLGYSALAKGLNKVEVDVARISSDLDHAWELLGEPIQTVMRKYGLEMPYEQLKALTRGKAVTREELAEFIGSLELPEVEMQRLLKLTPHTYIGNSVDAARGKENSTD